MNALAISLRLRDHRQLLLDSRDGQLQRHALALVEHDRTRRDSVPLRSGRRLLDVEGTIEELRRKALTVGDAWLRVKVRTDGPVPGIVDEVRAILPNAVPVTPDYPRAAEEEVAAGLMALRPREQFLSFYKSKHAAEPPGVVLEAFDEIHRAVEGDA